MYGIVIICLLFGALSTQLSAQSESIWGSGGFHTQVWCDGEMLGWAGGIMDFHATVHWKDGNYVFGNYQAKGEAVCDFSEEKFTYKEKGKEWMKTYPVGYYTVLLKGDQGSTFKMFLSIDWSQSPPEWTVLKANCN